MGKTTKIVSCLLLAMVFSQAVQAQGTLYWLGAVSTDWSDPDNWSASSGGTAALAPPTSTTNVVIQPGTFGCHLVDDVVVASVQLESGATLDVATSELEVTGDFDQSGGTFQGRSSAVSVGGNLHLTGGDFYNTTGVLTVGGDFIDEDDVFRYVNGTVRLTGEALLQNYDFINRLDIANSASVELGNVLPIITGLNIDGTLVSEGHTVYLANTDGGAVTGNGGMTLFPNGGGDLGFFIRHIGEETGSYAYPFVPREGSGKAPVVAHVKVAGEAATDDGNLWVTTLAQTSAKEPDVSALGILYRKEYGSDNSTYNVNRLWNLFFATFDVAPEMDVDFYYTAEDLEGTAINEINLRAQFWDATLGWQPPVGSVDIAANKVTVTDFVDAEGFWVLVDNSSPNHNISPLYWTGDDDADWANGLNWSWEPCGPPADTIPDSTMTVVFTGCADIQAVLSSNASVGTVTYTTDYSHIIDEAVFTLSILEHVVFDHVDVNVGAGSMTFGSGLVLLDNELTLATGSITVANDVTIKGGKIAGEGTITANNLYLNSGEILPEGVLDIVGNVNVLAGSVRLGEEELHITGTLTVDEGLVEVSTGTLEVDGDINIYEHAYLLSSEAIINLGEDFLQTGGQFISGASTIGIAGNFSAISGIFTSTSEELSVAGNFTIGPNVFRHNDGTVKLTGSNKTIDLGEGLNIKEVTTNDKGFYNLELGTGGLKIAASDIQVNHVLDFEDGVLKLDGNSLVVNTNLTAGITFNTGGILAEEAVNGSWIRWNIGEEDETYTIPMLNASSERLDVEVDITTPGEQTNDLQASFIALTSYATDAQLEPYPEAVTHWYNENGVEDFTNIVPRIWTMQTGNYKTEPEGTITIKYTNTDIAGIGFSENDLKIQRWTADGWDAAEGTVSTGANTLTLSGAKFPGNIVLVNGADWVLGKLTTVSYAALMPELDGGYYHTMNSRIYYRYDNPYNDEAVTVKVYDWKRDMELNTTANMAHGTNWATQNLTGLGLTEGSYYTLEVTNSKGVTTKLRFKYVISVTISLVPSGFGALEEE